ncbi:MAG: hypothetical protein ACLR2O_15310 [Coprococcus sp.]
MKELLYKKSKAVAALNHVDGFHPMELARKIGEEGQEEQLYLDVKYRKLWFRPGQSGRKDHQPDYHFHREYGSCGSTYLSRINVIRKTIM